MAISHDAELHELAFISVVYFNISTWERCYCIGLRINIITWKSCRSCRQKRRLPCCQDGRKGLILHLSEYQFITCSVLEWPFWSHDLPSYLNTRSNFFVICAILVKFSSNGAVSNNHMVVYLFAI